VTVMYTMYGDANVDGKVNADDLIRVLANYNAAGNWSAGDFNYDGVVNSDDLIKILANYNAALPDLVVNGSSLDGAALNALKRPRR